MSKKIINFYVDVFLEDQRLSRDTGPIEWVNSPMSSMTAEAKAKDINQP